MRGPFFFWGGGGQTHCGPDTQKFGGHGPDPHQHPVISGLEVIMILLFRCFQEFQAVSSDSSAVMRELIITGYTTSAFRLSAESACRGGQRCILAVCQSCNELRRSCDGVPPCESITVTRQETNCFGASGNWHTLVTYSDSCSDTIWTTFIRGLGN